MDENETGPPAEKPDGSFTLNEARAFKTRFVAYPSPAAADVATLWDMHTWCVGNDGKLLFDSTPRLAYLSDRAASGKSRALEVDGALCRKPALAADVTGPGIYAAVREGHCILIDELDLVLGAGDAARPVRAAINAGYRRSGGVLRAGGVACSFAPVAMAGLETTFNRNPLLAPTKSRTIVITMKPNQGKVRLDTWRDRIHRPEAEQITAAMEAWASASAVELVTTWPELPDTCDDRNMDLWEPLFIVAAVAGGDWPERISAAWEELGAGRGSTDDAIPPGMRLLGDIRAVWPKDRSRLTTAELVGLLMAAPGSVWPSVWRDAAQIPKEMAELLRPYDIAPQKLRPGNGLPAVQGYYRMHVLSVPGVPGGSAGA